MNPKRRLSYIISLSLLTITNLLLLGGVIDSPIQGILLKPLSLVIIIFIAAAGIFAGKYPKTERHPLLDRLINISVFLAIWLLFLGNKLLYLTSDIVRSSDDTRDFIIASAHNYINIWLSYKPPLLPALIRLLGYTNGDYGNHDLLHAVAHAQMLISIVAWTILAATVARLCFKNKTGQFVSFTLILFFSTTLDVSLWDRLTLSESLSISTLALWLAGIIWVVHLAIQKTQVSGRLKIIAGTLFIITTFLYTSARDTNIYFVIGSVIVIDILLLMVKFPVFRNTLLIFITLFSVVAYIFQSNIYEHSNRWHPVIMDLMSDRIAPNPEAVRFFEQEGMPPVEHILANSQYNNFKDFLDSKRAVIIEGNVPGTFDYWFQRESKNTYLAYLLHDPYQAIVLPFLNADKMLFESSYEYREPNGSLSQRISLITKLLFPYNIIEMIILSIMVIGLLIYQLLQRRIESLGILIAAMLITIPPLIMLVWVGGSLEVPRHALQITVQYRLAVWSGILLIFDLLFGKIKTRFNVSPHE